MFIHHKGLPHHRLKTMVPSDSRLKQLAQINHLLVSWLSWIYIYTHTHICMHTFQGKDQLKDMSLFIFQIQSWHERKTHLITFCLSQLSGFP